MKAIILSAGKGERMYPLTKDIPKPMIPLNDRPLLEYNLKLLKKYGVRDVAINLSYLPDKIINFFGDGSNLEIRIKYSYEKNLLGTAGALNNFRDFFDERFFVIYGDNFTNLDLDKMNSFHNKKKSIATLFLHNEKLRDRKTTPGIIITDDNEKIKNIFERPSKEEKGYINKIPKKYQLTNSGLYLFDPEILNYIPKNKKSDFAQDIFPAMLSKNEKIYGFTENCFYRELGSMKRYKLTLQEIKEGKINLEI